MSHVEHHLSPELSRSVQPVRRSEVLSALSLALDLTDGAVEGHALRTCLLGMRLAAAIDLPERLASPLFYALLLKDVGCSSNSGRLSQIFGGDERVAKSLFKVTDWTQPSTSPEILRYAWRSVSPGAGLLRRLRQFVHLARNSKGNTAAMIQLRCERGAVILRTLGLSPHSADAIHALDEHWNGSGYPTGLRGTSIPLLARIGAVAQHLDAFSSRKGTSAALEALRARSGTWYDPAIVAAALRLSERHQLWTGALPSMPVAAVRQAVLQVEPGDPTELLPREIDSICAAFAAAVDAKSSFTYRHSVGVADIAERLAERLELPPDRIEIVRRAALLHDIGKLGTPSAILNKPAKLSDAEFAVMQEHATHGRRILSHLAAFHEIATIAGSHHERLDGSGYPLGLKASDLSLEARIVAVADIFSALSEDRPYRKAMSLKTTIDILRSNVPHRVDPRCFQALLDILPSLQNEPPAPSYPESSAASTPDLVLA